MPNEYPEEFKLKVIHRYEKGESIKSLSEELHIAQSTLYHWRKEYCSIEMPTHTYTPAEFDAISRKLQKAERKLQIIRSSGLLAESPLQGRLEILERMYRQPENIYSVHELCEALEVARGTFYNHIFRRADRSQQKAEQEMLMLQVQQVFDDSEQRFGAEKIRQVLVRNGIQISKKRIAAIMRELDLHSVRTGAKKQYKKLQKHAKQNLVKGEFTPQAPNQIWVSDITYFRVNEFWVYLCIILDLYARKIIGFRVSKNASTNLVTATFRSAYKERGMPQGLTFHSDRGVQYTSNTMIKLLQDNGVKQSFSATQRPHDNAVAEAFFASFKKEEAYRREYTSEESFRRSVEKYIQFYNEVRPNQTLRYQTPQAYESQYFAEHIEKTCSNMGTL